MRVRSPSQSSEATTDADATGSKAPVASVQSSAGPLDDGSRTSRPRREATSRCHTVEAVANSANHLTGPTADAATHDSANSDLRLHAVSLRLRTPAAVSRQRRWRRLPAG